MAKPLSRSQVAFWLVVLAPVWPLLFALAMKTGHLPITWDWYARTNPVASTWILTLSYAAVLYLFSVVSGNASIFDVHWSVLPASYYAIAYAFHPMMRPNTTRIVLVLGAIWFWSLRLTGNWLKKGALSFEDFRYENYRKSMSPKWFPLFSFVALFEVQAAMTIAMTLPVYFAFKVDAPISWIDLVALVVVVAAVVFEWTADLQGMAFRTRREEHRRLYPKHLEGPTPKFPRFPQEGLWKWSRHPNYFGEVMVWWGVYLFAVAATGKWLNWTIVGPLTINGLFVGGSIKLTEEHELARKPEYADYQKRVSRLFPMPPSG